MKCPGHILMHGSCSCTMFLNPKHFGLTCEKSLLVSNEEFSAQRNMSTESVTPFDRNSPHQAPEEEIPSKDNNSAEPARSGGFLAVTKEEETAKGLCDIDEADDWKLMRDAAVRRPTLKRPPLLFDLVFCPQCANENQTRCVKTLMFQRFASDFLMVCQTRTRSWRRASQRMTSQRCCSQSQIPYSFDQRMACPFFFLLCLALFPLSMKQGRMPRRTDFCPRDVLVKHSTQLVLKVFSLQIVTDASSADLSVPLDEDGCLNFYWFDAYEEPAKPGRIYMFGKVKTGEKVPRSQFERLRPCQSCSVR